MGNPISEALREVAKTVRKIGEMGGEGPGFNVGTDIYDYLNDLQSLDNFGRCSEAPVHLYFNHYIQGVLNTLNSETLSPEQIAVMLENDAIEFQNLMESEQGEDSLRQVLSDAQDLYKSNLNLPNLMKFQLDELIISPRNIPEGEAINLKLPPQYYRDLDEIAEGLKINTHIDQENAKNLLEKVRSAQSFVGGARQDIGDKATQGALSESDSRNNMELFQSSSLMNVLEDLLEGIAEGNVIDGTAEFVDHIIEEISSHMDKINGYVDDVSQTQNTLREIREQILDLNQREGERALGNTLNVQWKPTN